MVREKISDLTTFSKKEKEKERERERGKRERERDGGRKIERERNKE